MHATTTPPLTPAKRRRAWPWFVCITAYLGVYVFLSVRGQYLGHNQGGQDNRDSWSPAYCAELYTSPAGRQKMRLTALGWLFLPPMLLDQWFIHRTSFE
jgi:hypothetical protein